MISMLYPKKKVEIIAQDPNIKSNDSRKVKGAKTESYSCLNTNKSSFKILILLPGGGSVLHLLRRSER